MARRSYRIRKFENGRNKTTQEPYVNYSLTIPVEVARALEEAGHDLNVTEFIPELSSAGNIIYKPHVPSSNGDAPVAKQKAKTAAKPKPGPKAKTAAKPAPAKKAPAAKTTPKAPAKPKPAPKAKAAATPKKPAAPKKPVAPKAKAPSPTDGRAKPKAPVRPKRAPVAA